MLPMVICITNGTISEWESLSLTQIRGSLDLVLVTFLII